MELAEWQLHVQSFRERRPRGRAEVPDPRASQRTSRRARPRWLSLVEGDPVGRLPPKDVAILATAGRAEGLVPRKEGAGGVDPARDRAGGSRARRSTAARPARTGVCPALPTRSRPVARARRPSRSSALPGECRVRVVDLGHETRRDARRCRVVADQVRMVPPGEPPPRRLDLRRCRAWLDSEDVVRVSFHHGRIISVLRRGPA